MLPGGLEHRTEAAYREQGIKISVEQEERLRELGAESGVAIPWD
jgi:hypothetical protein